jgi:hypothetical protein
VKHLRGCPLIEEGGIMDRLKFSIALSVAMCAATLWLFPGDAAGRPNAHMHQLMTPRLVSATGGGSLKPGAPGAKPSYVLSDAVGGGPGFPTRMTEHTGAQAATTTGTAPAATSVWSTTLIASVAFLVGAGLAAAIGHRRSRRPLVVA